MNSTFFGTYFLIYPHCVSKFIAAGMDRDMAFKATITNPAKLLNVKAYHLIKNLHIPQSKSRMESCYCTTIYFITRQSDRIIRNRAQITC